MIYPASIAEPLVHITPFHFESMGLGGYNVAGVGMRSCASANFSGFQNTALFFPFTITKPIKAQKLFIYNGAAVSGNIDLGIYSPDGTKIVSAGSTAQAGTSAIQTLSITATQIGAGVYYLAFVIDNATGTAFTTNLGSAAVMAGMGKLQATTSFPLPATATFSAITEDYFPIIGLTTRSFV